MARPAMSEAGNRRLQGELLSPASLALIADTEPEPTRELVSVQLSLTMARGQTPDGTPMPRCFIASTEISGRTINATQGKKSAAFNALQKQLQRMGVEPMWVAFTDLTVTTAPADETEEEPVPTVEPAFPGDEPPVLDESGEHEDPAFGLVAVPPVLDKGGWLTPLSDPLAWKRCYLAAWELVTGFSVFNFRDLSREGANMRVAVAAVMMSGDAGARVGVPARAVNPWAQGTNGERDMPWVRVLQGTPDPTTKPYRAGAGDRRDAYLTNLSGLPVNPERHESARQWRERRSARSFVGIRGSANTVAAKDARNEKRAQAHAAGLAAKEAAYSAGHDDDIAEAHYKWAYCAVLRFLGEIHAEFERQLANAGVTEGQILETVSQMKAA